MITIDGSEGEGGGQILRTALALSLVTQQPFRIEKIRAGREKPGLLRQHLTAVKAAAEIGQAQLEGAEIGSQRLTFSPGPVKSGRYRFAVGTAGSATLVLQTVLAPLLLATGRSELVLEGGTHNPFAPPFHFLDKTFLPTLGRMGATVSASLERPGFYPAGGGRFHVNIEPSGELSKLDLLERGEIRTRKATVLICGLPRNIADRELDILRAKLPWTDDSFSIEVADASFGPGNVILLELGSDQLTEVFTGFGERGVSAENVAGTAVEALRAYLSAGVPVGEYLADQLILPMILAGGGSLKTLPLSRHATTNMETVRHFLDAKFSVEKAEPGTCIVSLSCEKLSKANA